MMQYGLIYVRPYIGLSGKSRRDARTTNFSQVVFQGQTVGIVLVGHCSKVAEPGTFFLPRLQVDNEY